MTTKKASARYRIIESHIPRPVKELPTRLITDAELANRLSVPIERVWEWQQNQEGPPYILVSGQALYDEKIINEYARGPVYQEVIKLWPPGVTMTPVEDAWIDDLVQAIKDLGGEAATSDLYRSLRYKPWMKSHWRLSDILKQVIAVAADKGRVDVTREPQQGRGRARIKVTLNE